MGTSPIYNLRYPELDDTPDVPRDIKNLVDDIEANDTGWLTTGLAVGGGGVSQGWSTSSYKLRRIGAWVHGVVRTRYDGTNNPTAGSPNGGLPFRQSLGTLPPGWEPGVEDHVTFVRLTGGGETKLSEWWGTVETNGYMGIDGGTPGATIYGGSLMVAYIDHML